MNLLHWRSCVVLILGFKKAKNTFLSLHDKRRVVRSTSGVKCCHRAIKQNGRPLKSNSSGYIQRVVVQPSGFQRRKKLDGGPTIVAYIHQLSWWWSKSGFKRSKIEKYRWKVQNGTSMTVSHLCHITIGVLILII